MVRNATVKVTFRDGGQLSFVNARAEEGNGRLTVFKAPDPKATESTATILANLDSASIASWQIDESDA